MHKLTISVDDEVFERLSEGKGVLTEEEYAAIVIKRYVRPGVKVDSLHESVIERLDELEGRIKRLNALLLR
jgi:predicted CopG family antitoxin